jgi:carboxymethylenebutenolidase
MLQQEFDSLTPSRAFSRRDFVRTGVGSGFAAAVLPTLAQTAIHTDSSGLSAGEAMLTVGDHRLPVYYARPQGRTGVPVVLVVSEIFGVHEHIADVTRRFAKLGHLAIAPELFGRQGDPTMYGEVARLIAEVVSKTPDAEVMTDLDACVDWAQREGGDTTKLGVTGFCWGGRITWLYAAHQPKVKAGVAWYGRLVGDATALQPKHPVDVAAGLHAPVLGLYGGADAGIPLDTVDKMKAALARGSPAARQSQFVVYPDAPHAFHADYRPSYRKEAAEDGWKRCIAWFKSHGVG